MILDYNFNKKSKQMTISYVTEGGGKAILKYNVSRFKSYMESPTGQFTNWNGNKCTQCWVERPGWTEYKTFLNELPEADRKLLFAKHNPKLYTFDIEVKIEPDQFPDPDKAEYPILNISCVNDRLDAIVLGIKGISNPDKITKLYHEWLSKCEFFVQLGLPMPRFQYILFESEGDMINYFFRKICAKAPVLAGWNSLGFDWYYFQNRVKNYFPEIPLACSSTEWLLGFKQISNFGGQKIRLQTPVHTLVLDMMDIIGTFDIAVMPVKESLSLDYIARESIGVGKIKYTGDLQHLYETDYETYVFYNLIDSVLVQLIDKRFKTLEVLYAQALLCKNKISDAFSKIAITENMFFNYFYDHDIKVVPQEGFHGERPTLVGAYVRQTTPGKHRFVCCNDFASLYPSAIITCNLSIENYMGSLRDGKFKESDLDKYRADPNYFVSVNGCVYKNDKDYAFKNIQWGLKKLRGVTKYLSKKLDAQVVSDLEHILSGRDFKPRMYDSDVVEYLRTEFNINAPDSEQLKLVPNLKDFKKKLVVDINGLTNKELAIKLIMNAMYGGSSHVAFEWFNCDLANDITGEGRNLIHIMEHTIPTLFQEKWYEMTDLHEKLGIRLKKRVG